MRKHEDGETLCAQAPNEVADGPLKKSPAHQPIPFDVVSQKQRCKLPATNVVSVHSHSILYLPLFLDTHPFTY